MSNEANDSATTISRPLMASTVLRLPVKSLRESCCLGVYLLRFSSAVDPIAYALAISVSEVTTGGH